MPRPRTATDKNTYFVVLARKIYLDIDAPENQRSLYEVASQYIKEQGDELPDNIYPVDVVEYARAFKQTEKERLTPEVVNAMLRQTAGRARPGDREIIVKAYQDGVFDVKDFPKESEGVETAEAA